MALPGNLSSNLSGASLPAQGLEEHARATAVEAAATLVYGLLPSERSETALAALDSLAHRLICEAGHGAVFGLCAGGRNVVGDELSRSQKQTVVGQMDPRHFLPSGGGRAAGGMAVRSPQHSQPPACSPAAC